MKSDGHKKACLVVKGFSQVEGLDFDQVFSPVVRFETVCLMLVLAALENWYITGLNVQSAYLYGKLDKEIYMEYICCYVIGTSLYSLVYNGGSSAGLIACTDSDWGSDPTSHLLQTGFYLKLGDGLISCTSHVQKTIVYSSTEAEYMALSNCTCQVTWIRSLLGELGYKLKAILICGDNQGSIFMASNPIMEPHSKHIDICYHGICESVAKGNMELFFIDGAENPADLLTTYHMRNSRSSEHN